MKTKKKLELRQSRRWRIRKKIIGTSQCPRMSVCFSNKNIHVQFINDETGVTVAAVSTIQKSLADRVELKANVASAAKIGRLAAEAAISKGVARVVFDRSGARYHGKVRALADAAREGGLKF